MKVNGAYLEVLMKNTRGTDAYKQAIKDITKRLSRQIDDELFDRLVREDFKHLQGEGGGYDPHRGDGLDIHIHIHPRDILFAKRDS